MCTSSTPTCSRGASAFRDGFTAVELIIGIALTLVLASAVGPLWVALEKSGVQEADRTIMLLQGRVAFARLERDLRLATAADSPFTTVTPVLQATPLQVVFLGPGTSDSAPDLYEWEVNGGRLMRRRGSCPATKPGAFPHSLYRDNKTMMEGLGGDSHFTYVVNGREISGPVSQEELSLVEAVIAHMSGLDDVGEWSEGLWAAASVGR